MTEKQQEYFRLIRYSYKHGGGTPVLIGDKFYVSFADEKTGHYEKVKGDTITLLDCSEVLPEFFHKDENGELEYWGDVAGESYKITLRPKDGPGFFDEYYAEEIVKITKRRN